MFISSNVLRIKEVNEKGQRFISYSVITGVLINFVIMLSNSIYILYSLAIVKDIFDVGLLLAFLFIIVALTDYPTSFITRFTQKQILIIASFLYLLGFFFFTIATNFFSLIIAFFFIGLAQGQESDAFRRYFEDNYYFYLSEDKERIIYNKVTFRMNFLINSSTVLAFIIGGLISVQFGRATVFAIQTLLLVVVIITITFLLRNNPQKENHTTKRNIIETIKENSRFCWLNESLRYFIVGSAISGSTMTIFGILAIFIIYDQYTTNDFLIGSIRALILIFASGLSLSEIFFKKYVKNRSWIIFISIMSSVSIFSLLIFFIGFFTANDASNLVILAILVLLISFSMLPQSLYKHSRDTFLLQVVPVKRREDVYSFLPLIMTAVNIPMILLGGYLIQQNLEDALVILLIISLIGSIISSYGFYLYNYRRVKKELITRTINVYFGGQFEINAFTTIQLPVKYIWDQYQFSAKKLWQGVVAEAVKDGSLTSDERKLIEKIMVQVRTYGLALQDVIDDAVITVDEEERLDFIRNQLFEIVFLEAKKDGVVTDEEYTILNVFKKHLENFKGFSTHTES